MKSSELVETDDKNTGKICRNFYDAENHIIFKLSNISISNFHRIILRLESKLCQHSIVSKCLPGRAGFKVPYVTVERAPCAPRKHICRLRFVSLAIL